MIRGEQASPWPPYGWLEIFLSKFEVWSHRRVPGQAGIETEILRMRMLLSAMVLLLGASNLASADDLSCISTTFRFTSPSDKVCISEFDDAKVPGVTCFISQARKGGWGQPLGLNEDPSNFSVSCRQMGPITADISKLPEKEEAFTEKTSIFFKATCIYRIPDVKRNAIIYLAVSSKIIEGSSASCRSCPGRGNRQGSRTASSLAEE
jgi:CreA protein